jgi:hypothetical protein
MEPTTTPAPAAPSPFYMSGVDDRPADNRVVAISVGVRAEMKVGDRDFSGVMMLHELVVMRRFYEARGGGSIRLQPGWLPGLDRYRKLIRSDLMSEIQRLRTSMVVAKQPGTPPVMCFNEFFGQEPGEQLSRMHEVMRQQYEAWKALLAKCKTRLTGDLTWINPHTSKREALPAAVIESMACDLMTEREMDDIANIANPSMRTIDDLELAPIDEPAPAAPAAPTKSLAEIEAEVAADEGDKAMADLDALMARLTAAGAKENEVLPLASLLEAAKEPGRISDDDIILILGNKGRLAAIRKAFKG